MPKDTIITTSGKGVCKHYRDNICCDDKDNKALTAKAESKREQNSKGKAKGLSRFGNESSEDALSWSVFRTLEIKNKIQIFYNLLGINDTLQKTIFWTRSTANSGDSHAEPQLQEVLDKIEPKELWKKTNRTRYC